MSKRVLKIVHDDWGAASRDRKELAICEELGAEVKVLVKGNVGDKCRLQKTHGFDAYYLDICPLGHSKLMMSGIFRKINTALSFFSWAHAARKFKPDIITGHDYVALYVGWLSTTFIPKKKRPKLVYDSHEFELGRNKKRSKLALWFVKRIEGFLIRRCAFTIIPNEAVADILAETYKVKKPIVARNIPVYWNLDLDVIHEKHNAFCDELHIPHDSFIILFHGGIQENRGIEMLIQISKKHDIPLVLLGKPTDNSSYNRLKKLSSDCGADKVLFKPAVPLEELWKYVGAANAEVVVAPGKFESYYHMLPNKFFESIQSLTPVIVSNFPDIGEIVDKYDIGLKVDPENEDEIVSAILRMRDDREMYAHFKANLIKAKEILRWENERMPLYEAYKEIIDD